MPTLPAAAGGAINTKMALQSQTVSQNKGFGNDEQRSLSEYYFGKGVRRSAQGLIFGSYLLSFFTTSNFSGLSSPNRIARAKGRAAYGAVDTVENVASYLFFGDAGNSNIYQAYLGVFTPDHAYRVLGQTWAAAGMIADPKGRLLYAGQRYLGMHDSATANYRTGTVALTNGSATVTGSGTTFVSGDVGKMFKVDGDTGTAAFYLISGYTSATVITLSTTYAGTTTASKGYTIYRGWLDTWKDFGASITGMADGTSFLSPMENYEDTVLIGRRNVIVSLNTLTDSVTTDASPAFDMPTNYDNVAISAGANGVLMGFNSAGKGVLVLWDNYSDRSIAPWIPTDDLILAVKRYSSGWVVITARGIFYTNGYSIEPMSRDFLETSFTALSGVTDANTAVIGDELHFGLGGSLNRVRGGLYRYNLKERLAEYIGNLSEVIYSAATQAIFYDPTFNRIYVCGTGGVSMLVETSINSSKNYYVMSSNLGVGENPKIAERIRLPLQLSRFKSSKTAITFSIEARINSLDRQMHNFGQIKSSGSNDTTHMVVDETAWPPAQVGDMVEFLDGTNNAGLIRGITAISGGGTATAIYTLDSALAAAPSTSNNFIWSGFKPIEKKTVTAASETPEIFFGIKNKYVGKHFKVMFIVTGATSPIEALPFEFQYDDTGVLE